MGEKLKHIEFKGTYGMSLEEAARVSGFLITRTSVYRESERSRLEHEVYGPDGIFGRFRGRARTDEEFDEDLKKSEEFSKRVGWLDRGIWESYYEIMSRLTPKDDRLSMTSLNIGLLGIKPVFLEQHWHTDDLDDPGRDYTEFQYMVVDPEISENPPLMEEVSGHVDFVTEGSPVSDIEIPRIQTFGTLSDEQLRDLLPG